MYKRFLNNDDYLAVITQEQLKQLIRNNTERLMQAEESAEISMVEYLSENYDIEREFNKGKCIAEYNRAISYPVGAFVYFEGKCYEVIRSISGFKAPQLVDYWEECPDMILQPCQVMLYSQFNSYAPGDLVVYNDVVFSCLQANGYKFSDIRLPMVNGWKEVEFCSWQAMTYDLWSVVRFGGDFYTLVSLDGYDELVNPLDSDCWGAIADYDREYNSYELSEHEYVVYDGRVFVPVMDVNADVPVVGVHLSLHDPRNYNLKKHMVRLAVYELSKLIVPNNVSVTRIRDYEDSMDWLLKASKLRINPQIPVVLRRIIKRLRTGRWLGSRLNIIRIITRGIFKFLLGIFNYLASTFLFVLPYSSAQLRLTVWKWLLLMRRFTRNWFLNWRLVRICLKRLWVIHRVIYRMNGSILMMRVNG